MRCLLVVVVEDVSWRAIWFSRAGHGVGLLACHFEVKTLWIGGWRGIG